MRYDELEDAICSIARPVSLLGDRWTFIILREAFRGVRRFDEFEAILGISRPVLSARLAGLVEGGVLERRAYAEERRTRHEYRLTDKGMDVYPILMALRAFADKHMSPDGPIVVYSHKGCGGATEVKHVCDACGQEVSARDVVAQPGPGTIAASA